MTTARRCAREQRPSAAYSSRTAHLVGHGDSRHSNNNCATVLRLIHWLARMARWCRLRRWDGVLEPLLRCGTALCRVTAQTTRSVSLWHYLIEVRREYAGSSQGDWRRWRRWSRGCCCVCRFVRSEGRFINPICIVNLPRVTLAAVCFT